MKKPKIKTTYTINMNDKHCCQEVYNDLIHILNESCEYKFSVIVKDKEIKIYTDYIESYYVLNILSSIKTVVKLNRQMYIMLCNNIKHSVIKFDICMNESKFPVLGIKQEYASFLCETKTSVQYEFHLEKIYEMEYDDNFLKPIKDDGKFANDKTKIMVEFYAYSKDDDFNVEEFSRDMDIAEARHWKKGDVWSQNAYITRLSKQNIWKYKTSYMETLDMHKVLDIVLDKIKNKDEIIIRASKIPSVTVAFEVVFYIEKDTAPNINISYDLIKYVNKINASFSFDPYW